MYKSVKIINLYMNCDSPRLSSSVNKYDVYLVIVCFTVFILVNIWRAGGSVNASLVSNADGTTESLQDV